MKISALVVAVGTVAVAVAQECPKAKLLEEIGTPAATACAETLGVTSFLNLISETLPEDKLEEGCSDENCLTVLERMQEYGDCTIAMAGVQLQTDVLSKFPCSSAPQPTTPGGNNTTEPDVSPSPTPSETMDMTSEPTMNPTMEPSEEPTEDPSEMPSEEPAESRAPSGTEEKNEQNEEEKEGNGAGQASLLFSFATVVGAMLTTHL